MRKNFFVLFSIITILGACAAPMPDKDNSLPEIKPKAPVSVESNPSQTLPSTNNVALNPPHGEPGHDCNVAVGAPLNGVSNSPNSPLPILSNPNNSLNIPPTNVRLNPPHGEPGHDCNVMVGQPLS